MKRGTTLIVLILSCILTSCSRKVLKLKPSSVPPPVELAGEPSPASPISSPNHSPSPIPTETPLCTQPEVLAGLSQSPSFSGEGSDPAGGILPDPILGQLVGATGFGDFSLGIWAENLAAPDPESGDNGHRVLLGNNAYPYPGIGGLLLVRNRFGFFDAYVGSGQALESGELIPGAGFHLYGVSRQGTQLVLWFDGLPKATLTASGPLTIAGADPLRLAGRWNGVEMRYFQFWKGRIGPYFFYPRALSSAEMAFLNSCGSP